MTCSITVAWHNAGPHTIWGVLAKKLGREPTHVEACAEVRRILHEAADARNIEMAGRGALWFQRGRAA